MNILFSLIEKLFPSTTTCHAHFQGVIIGVEKNKILALNFSVYFPINIQINFCIETLGKLIFRTSRKLCIRALKRNAFAAYVSFPRHCSTVLYSTQDRYRSLHKLFAGSSLISHSTNFNLFQLLQIVRQTLFPEVLFRWVSWFFPVKSKAIKIVLGICTCVLSFQT